MTDIELAVPPFRPIKFPCSRMTTERHDDGTIIVTPKAKLNLVTQSVSQGLLDRMKQPDAPFIAQRVGPDRRWLIKTNSEIKSDIDAVTQWYLDLDNPDNRPVLILASNSIENAVIRLAALNAGLPYCPVSVNYARMKGSYDRLSHVIDLINPVAVYADDTAAFKDALETVDLKDAVIVTNDPSLLSKPSLSYQSLLETVVRTDITAHIDALDTKKPAAYMLTSGSTGRPKAVIQTQYMMANNISQALQVLGQDNGWLTMTMDWMPWSHVAGSANFLGAVVGGGAFYIDDGKPLPGLFDETIRNLKDVHLEAISNVPAGYAMLADAMEKDEDLRRNFFRDMKLCLYGGAGLSQPLYDRFQKLAIETVGSRVFFTTGYGATETTSGCMSIYYESEEVGIGLPLPGVSLKLVPHGGDRYEIRIKAPSVTPGYLNAPDKTAEAFDRDGYYKLGDAATFIDPNDIQRGFAFAGRLAEEFKLDNGTWVSGGHVRADILKALEPLAREALVCGERRPYLALLLWLNEQATANIPDVSAAVREKISAYNAHNPGSSKRIERVMFLVEPPSVDAHEVSDKGTINQSLAIERRRKDVERLYAQNPDDSVIIINS